MTEMKKLINLLEKSNIPFETRDCHGTIQVCYPSIKTMICDAICHDYSYGHEEGLLEIMGLVDEDTVGDTVEGWLTAKEVYGRISEHYHHLPKGSLAKWASE